MSQVNNLLQTMSAMSTESMNNIFRELYPYQKGTKEA